MAEDTEEDNSGARDRTKSFSSFATNDTIHGTNTLLMHVYG